MNQQMGDPKDEFDELHWEIIEILREGRVTPSYLGSETGESRQLVSQRLRDLQLAGFVEKVHKGLYELDDDPQTEQREVQGNIETALDGTEAADSVESHEDPEPADPIADALAGWSYGRTEEEQEANRTVARASLEWLRETGESVRQNDVPLEELAEKDPEERTPDTIWRSVIRGAWNHATGQGHVEQPDSRAYKWSGGR